MTVWNEELTEAPEPRLMSRRRRWFWVVGLLVVSAFSIAAVVMFAQSAGAAGGCGGG